MLTRAHYAFIWANFLKKHIHKCTLFCCHRINFWELFCSVWSVQYCRFSFCWCFACCWDWRPTPLPVRVLAVVAQHSSAGWYPAAAYLSRWGGGDGEKGEILWDCCGGALGSNPGLSVVSSSRVPWVQPGWEISRCLDCSFPMLTPSLIKDSEFWGQGMRFLLRLHSSSMLGLRGFRRCNVVTTEETHIYLTWFEAEPNIWIIAFSFLVKASSIKEFSFSVCQKEGNPVANQVCGRCPCVGGRWAPCVGVSWGLLVVGFWFDSSIRHFVWLIFHPEYLSFDSSPINFAKIS